MNSNNFPPNINPQIFSLSAVLVGAALINDFSAIEQNAIGNWLMLVSQYIITSSAQQNLIESRINNQNNNRFNQNTCEDIDYLLLAVKRIFEELEKIKKEN